MYFDKCTHFINLTGLMIIYEGANVLPKRGDVNKNRIYFRVSENILILLYENNAVCISFFNCMHDLLL
jgi:hypothetical protein